MQRMIERKMNFFGHICRMQDERLIKQVVLGIMDGKNKRGRPKRRWTDDLADWCNKVICNLYTLAMDRKKWTHLVKYVVDTNGHWAHGARERERERENLQNFVKWTFAIISYVFHMSANKLSYEKFTKSIAKELRRLILATRELRESYE